MRRAFASLLMASAVAMTIAHPAAATTKTGTQVAQAISTIHYHSTDTEGVSIFYGEAGPTVRSHIWAILLRPSFTSLIPGTSLSKTSWMRWHR